MNVKAKYIQLIGDAILPLLGFFLWKWGLYFIIIFYLLDLIVKEVLMHFKSRKIVEYQMENGNWWRYGSAGALLFVAVVAIIHYAMWCIQPNIDFYNEWVKFMLYEDMGIAQGFVIVPLLIFVGLQQYKMEFLLPKMHKQKTLREIWFVHYESFFLILACVGFTIALSVWVIFDSYIYVLSIVILSMIFQFDKIRRDQ